MFTCIYAGDSDGKYYCGIADLSGRIFEENEISRSKYLKMKFRIMAHRGKLNRNKAIYKAHL